MPENKQHYTRVLIVEDEPTIAFALEELLVAAGFKVVGVAGRLDKALALIGSAVFDVAIVDTNLAGVSASPAASALTARGIPFIVLSGYSIEQLPDEFLGAHFLRKPFRPAQLFQSLGDIVLKR
ncbi:MAG: response regulator [Acetobacteraceae bacterium]